MVRGGVLIVDDDVCTARILAHLVNRLGYPAHAVFGGKPALDHMSQAVPELVILDLMMPQIDGIEVLTRMRQHPQTRGVPVVMFTAVCDPQVQQRAEAAGATEFWVKARVDFMSLGERLRPYLGEPVQAVA
jgi:CheY-like chemotaxis protein